MIKPEILNNLSKQFIDQLPPALKTMQEELEKTFKNTIHAILTQMDIVPRQEFEVQATLLAENKHKLEILEKEIKLLSDKVTLLEEVKK